MPVFGSGAPPPPCGATWPVLAIPMGFTGGCGRPTDPYSQDTSEKHRGRCKRSNYGRIPHAFGPRSVCVFCWCGAARWPGHLLYPLWPAHTPILDLVWVSDCFVSRWRHMASEFRANSGCDATALLFGPGPVARAWRMASSSKLSRIVLLLFHLAGRTVWIGPAPYSGHGANIPRALSSFCS